VRDGYVDVCERVERCGVRRERDIVLIAVCQKGLPEILSWNYLLINPQNALCAIIPCR